MSFSGSEVYSFVRTDTGYDVSVLLRTGKFAQLGSFSYSSIYRCIKRGDMLLFMRRRIWHAVLCISTEPYLIVHNPGILDPDENTGIEIKSLSDELEGKSMITIYKPNPGDSNKWYSAIVVSDALSQVGRQGYHLLSDSCQTFTFDCGLPSKTFISVEAVVRFLYFLEYALPMLTSIVVAFLGANYTTPVVILLLAVVSAFIAFRTVPPLVHFAYRIFIWIRCRWEDYATIQNLNVIVDEVIADKTNLSEKFMSRLEDFKLQLMHEVRRWKGPRHSNGLPITKRETRDEDNPAWAIALDTIQWKIFRCMFFNYSISSILEADWDGHLNENTITGLRIMSNYNQPYFECMSFKLTTEKVADYLTDLCRCISAPYGGTGLANIKRCDHAALLIQKICRQLLRKIRSIN